MKDEISKLDSEIKEKEKMIDDIKQSYTKEIEEKNKTLTEKEIIINNLIQ